MADIFTALQNIEVAPQDNQGQAMQDLMRYEASQTFGKQSALSNKGILGNLADRTKWGFADQSGKYKILIQNQGYAPEDIKTLQNGEFGVQIKDQSGNVIGIKPVDPKGFQFGDMVGDVAESVGGLLAVGGQAGGAALGSLASPVGSIAGAGAGAAIGETAKQKIGEMLGVRDSGMSEQDRNDVLLAGVFGAAGQGASLGIGKLLTSLTKAGSVKGAASSLSQPSKIQIGKTTEASNVISDALGFKDANSDIITRHMKNPNAKVTKHLDALISNVDEGINNLITNKNAALSEKILQPGLQREMIRQGVNRTDDILLDTAPAVKGLNKLSAEISKRKLAPTTKQALLDIVEGQKQAVLGSQKVTLGETKQLLNDIWSQAQSGDNKLMQETYKKIYGKFAGARDFGLRKSMEPGAYQKYSVARRQLDGLDELLRTKLTETGIESGQAISYRGMPPAAKIQRLVADKQQRNYNQLYKLLDKAKESGIDGVEKLTTDIDNLLMNTALSKAKYEPGLIGKTIGSVPGVGKFMGEITDPFTNPVHRAAALKGAVNLGIIDADSLTKPTAEKFFATTRALSKMVNAKGIADKVGVMDAVKALPKNMQPAARKAIVAGGSQSLNKILFGDKQ